MTFDIVMKRAALAEGNSDHAALCRICRLADRLRNFARLAVAEADPAFLVAHDNECCEREAASTFHNLGHTIDVNELIDDTAGIALFALAVAIAATSAATPALTASRGPRSCPGACAIPRPLRI
jgi:hypothetical protein